MWSVKATSVGLQSYDQEKKKKDKNKAMYYPALVLYVKSLQSYQRYFNFGRPPRVLSLEDLGMISATRMHQECGIPVEYFDLVSRDVVFSSFPKNKKHGIFYTGELYDFLQQSRITKHRYDVLNLDSCNTWDKLKRCIKLVFERQLMDIVSFLMITCSSRDSSTEHRKELAERQGEKLPQNTSVKKCEADVIKYAERYGYAVHANHPEFTYGTMYCLFFKVIHWESTMSYDGGIPGPWTASYWLQEPMVFDTPTGERIKKVASKKVASKKVASKKVASKKANILKVKGRPVGKRQRRKTR